MLLCVTPWPEQFRRYMTPVAPFLLVALFSSLLSLGNWLRTFGSKFLRRFAPIALIAVLALIFDTELRVVYWTYRNHLDRVSSETYDGRLVDYRLFYYSPGFESLDLGLDWLKKRAKPEDVVAVSMAHWAYLKTGLKSVFPPFESNAERALALLDSVPVTYFVLDLENSMVTNTYFLPLVQGNPQAWKPVYMDEKGLIRIYERVRSQDRDKGKQ
jgi:hypothetical protein